VVQQFGNQFMDKDTSIMKPDRVAALEKDLDNYAHFISSPNSCLNLLWARTPPGRLARLILDVSRIKYDDPDGQNTQVIKIVGHAMGIDLLKPYSPAGMKLDGYLEFENAGKRYGKTSVDLRNAICISEGLLYDISLEDDLVVNLVLSNLQEDWGQIRRHLPVPTDDLVIVDAKLSGDFIQNSWLKAYLNKKSFSVRCKKGAEFWPNI
jgi:hypothetical protein